jgi:hypothetical protein
MPVVTRPDRGEHAFAQVNGKITTLVCSSAAEVRSASTDSQSTASPETTSSGGKTVAVFFHQPEEGAAACPPVERVERRIE